MTRLGALALGLSYACLWFVNLAGDPFRIAALALMVAGLALLVADLVAPQPCQCGHAPAEVDEGQDDEQVAGCTRACTEGHTFEPGCERHLASGFTVSADMLASGAVGVLPEHRDLDDVDLDEPDEPRPYLDPDTTGPIPLVRAVDLDLVAALHESQVRVIRDDRFALPTTALDAVDERGAGGWFDPQEAPQDGAHSR